MRTGEENWQEVSVARLFPFSEPKGWLSVLDKDKAEIGILRDLEELTPECQAHIEEEIARSHIMPRITRIVSSRNRADLIEWSVETDRGPATFLTRSLRDQVESPFPNRLLIKDVDDNRYEIPDVTKLPLASRRLLDERL